jgi:DNA-binding MarR family transcriptional regulator
LPDLTPTQFSALYKLQNPGAVSQNELGRQVAMDAATVKEVIEHLRIRELVKVSPSRTDLRRFKVSLTATGPELMAAAIPKVHGISRMTLHRLNKREGAQLLGLLDKLIE